MTAASVLVPEFQIKDEPFFFCPRWITWPPPTHSTPCTRVYEKGATLKLLSRIQSPEVNLAKFLDDSQFVFLLCQMCARFRAQQAKSTGRATVDPAKPFLQDLRLISRKKIFLCAHATK